jgi:protein gp37
MVFGPNGEAGGCYAESLAGIRFANNPLLTDWHGLAARDENGDPHWTGVVRFIPRLLDAPLRVRKGTRVFVNDMSDTFHAKVEDDQIAAIFGVMGATQQHIYYLLTKRDRRAEKWFEWVDQTGHGMMRGSKSVVCSAAETMLGTPASGFLGTLSAPDPAAMTPEERRATTRRNEIAAMIYQAHVLNTAIGWPLPNVAIGVTVDDRKHGVPRIDTLRRIPAARKFLSVEPLLEDIGDVDLTGIDLVIVGGESGKGARAFDLRWARRIQAQCDEQRVGYFFKQAGDNAVDASGLVQLRTRKGKALEELPPDLRRRDRLVFGGSVRWQRGTAESAVLAASGAL